MRGKLRDKRTEMKRENFKRESMERRRPNRRENRNMALLNLQLDQEEYLLDEDDEVLVWMGGAASPPTPTATPAPPCGAIQ